MTWHRVSLLLVTLTLTLITSGCGSDDSSGESGEACPLGQERNALTGKCEDRDTQFLDAGDVETDTPGADAGTDSDDSGSADGGPEDTGQDSGDDAAPPCPDRDGDGSTDQACGGQDCNDNNPLVAPGMPEVCDAHDNDCNGELNQGLQCEFYAHSNNDMYLVNPFAKTATHVTTVPGLFDVDTHPDGTLYGITSSALYEYSQSSWTRIGGLGVSGTPNGLAIDNLGTAYMTASNTVYTVDLATGSATRIGSMGGSYNSSGDCVVNKDNSLYMSSNHNFTGDNLVLIDGDTGQAQDIGATGFREIYGLTAAWGRMFGLTGSGQIIEIDSGTGQGTLIHTFSSISWYGAASTPQR